MASPARLDNGIVSPPRTGPILRALLLALALTELVFTLCSWCRPPVGILLFHQLAEPTGPADFWTVAPGTFRAILDRIDKLGFRTLDDAGLLERLDGKGRPGPACLLTFDDGLESHAAIAAPELAGRGMRGLFFVVTDKLGQGRTMSRTQAEEIVSAGLRLGSHSATHGPVLRQSTETTSAYTERLEREIVLSRAAVRELALGGLAKQRKAGTRNTGTQSGFAGETGESGYVPAFPPVSPVSPPLQSLASSPKSGSGQRPDGGPSRRGASALAFAYPAGDLSPEARSMVGLAGYLLAFTTELGHASLGSDRLALPRNLLFRDATPDSVEAYLTEPLQWLQWRLLLDQLLVLLLVLSFGLRQPPR